MGLYDKLTNGDSKLSINNGGDISFIPGASSDSLLHFAYSINGRNEDSSEFEEKRFGGLSWPAPSSYDREGYTPAQYINNQPE